MPLRKKEAIFPSRAAPKMAPATRLPEAFDSYFLPALVAILEKFLPGLLMAIPARPPGGMLRVARANSDHVLMVERVDHNCRNA